MSKFSFTAAFTTLVCGLSFLIFAGPAAAEEVVKLGYFPNVTHAQAVIGVARGDFQKALGPDVKLETSVYNAGPSVIEAVYAGHLDIAYVGPSPIINGFIQSKGEEVRVIAGAAINGVLIVGNKQRGITKLDQLKGKTIASPQLGNTQDISAKDFVVSHLKTNLKDRGGDTEVLPIPNPDIENLFAKNQLDAAWVPEPWGSRLISKGFAVLISEEKELWPGKRFSLTNVIARREFLEKHPELVKNVLQAHVKLTYELQSNPSSFADVLNAELKKLTSKDLPADVMQSALRYTQFTNDPGPESFEKFYKMGKELKLVRGTSLDLARLIDTTLLKQIEAANPAPAPASTGTSATAAAK
ncbi:MAG: ABC transporter substrate-binding protein [Candidatus Sumerlaeaceae bacterium]